MNSARKRAGAGWLACPMADMPSSPQVTKEGAYEPKWTILTFKSESDCKSFVGKFDEKDLWEKGITMRGRKLKTGPFKKTNQNAVDNQGRKPHDSLQKSRSHHHGGSSSSFEICAMRSSSSFELAHPPPMQPVPNLQPYMQQQVPSTARPPIQRVHRGLACGAQG